MNDRSDELSTADLAGRSSDSEAIDERADRDEGADRTGERRDGFPGDRGADAGYADGRDAHAADRAYADDRPHAEDGAYADDGPYADDRLDGLGSRDVSGGTGPDAAADDAAADRADLADSSALPADRVGVSDDPAMPADRPGHTDNSAMAADRGYADDQPGMTTGGPGYPDDVAGAPAGDSAVPGVRGQGMTGQGSGYGGTDTSGNGTARQEPLLGSADTEGFRARWTDVQTGFVDEPRRAVEQADGLTAELMQHLAKSFADERLRLERQWDRGEDIATDDLRTAFQRYRSFFERLLST